jgi:hypothetical protein
MAIFNRKNKNKELHDESEPTQKEKVKFSKRPASMFQLDARPLRHRTEPLDTAFKQQRLKAWQPILTPKAVLPTLFIIGLIFAPIGALIVWGSGKVTTITLDYTQCDVDAPASGDAEAMPSDKYSCKCTSPLTVLSANPRQMIFPLDLRSRLLL